MNAEEKARAEKLQVEQAKQVFVFVRAALREILGVALNAAPDQVDIVPSPTGKPELRSRKLKFSVSHSETEALIALAEEGFDGEVGVDLELRSDVKQIQRFTNRILAPGESLESLGIDLFEVWTRKEAVMKALGLGLGLSFAQIQLCGEFAQTPHGKVLCIGIVVPRGKAALALTSFESTDPRAVPPVESFQSRILQQLF